MKKIVTLLVLVFAFTLTTQAQRTRPNLNAKTMLAKMTTDLSLTEDQQLKIKPLLVEQVAENKAMEEARKAQRESGARPSEGDREKMKEERQVKETAFMSKLETILSKEQLEKYKTLSDELKKNRRGGGQRRN